MTDQHGARVEIVRDEQPGPTRAARRFNAGTRLGNHACVGLRPAAEPGRGRLRSSIRSENDRAESLVPDRLVKYRLPVRELAGDLRVKVRRRLPVPILRTR